MNNIQNILDALKEYANKNILQVYIPSLKKEVGFRPITGAQQKKLYDAGYDNLVFRTKFIIATYEIIAENCLEQDITNELNVLDRLAILLVYRKTLHGDVIKSEYGDAVVTESIGKLAKIQDLAHTIEYDKIKIDIEVPKIIEQYRHEKEIRYQQVLAKKDTKNFVEALGDMYIGETCKCVKEIYVENSPINFKQFTPQEQIAIIETLPVNLINKVGEFIRMLFNLNTEVLTVKAKKEDTETSIVLDINTEFLVEI